MALEDLTGAGKFLGSLVVTNPVASDDRREGDDHIRGIKNVLRNTFANVNAAVTLTAAQINSALLKTGGTMTGQLTMEGVPVYSNRASAPTQGVYLAGDTGMIGGVVGSAAIISSRSSAGNAKPLLVECSTDDAHTAPTSGIIAIAFRILGVEVGRFVGNLFRMAAGTQIQTPDGSNALPSYSFTGSASTGLYSPAVGEWALASSGIKRLRVNNNGKVCVQLTGTTPVAGEMDTSELIFTRSTDTVLRLSMKGSDGVVRNVTLTLS